MSKDKEPKETYTVGYGRPPAQHRFQKGKSGNPKGRPKGRQKGLQEKVAAELMSKINIKEQGTVIRVTKEEAIIKRLTNEALNGNLPAMRLLLAYKSVLDAEVRKQEDYSRRFIISFVDPRGQPIEELNERFNAEPKGGNSGKKL